MQSLLGRAMRASRLSLAPDCNARAHRALFATLDPKLQEELDRVRVAMADAVESTRYVADSAQQAYLEAEPSSRGLIESYYMRYLRFSHSQVLQALKHYDEYAERLGQRKMREVEQQQDGLALAVADAMLARDHLSARIAEEEERAVAKQKEGLRRADLVHCD